MDSIEESFDEVFKWQGGLFPYENISNPIYLIALAYCRSLVRSLGEVSQSDLSVYVGLVDNKEFGVSSAKKGLQYFIGINRGIIDILLNIFARMLANNRLVPFIGSSDDEAKTKEAYDPKLTQAEQLKWSDVENLLPSDLTRKAMVCQFTLTALEFMVSHEYAHVKYGHIDYLYSPFGRAELKSPDGKLTNESETRIFQSLELIADDFAVGEGLLVLQGKYDDRQSIDVSIRHLYDSWPSMLRLWFFPVYTCFRILGHTSKAYSLHEDPCMPPPVRANMVINVIAFVTEAVFRLDIGATELSDLLVSTSICVEEAFAELSGSFDLEPIKFSLSDEVWAYMKKLQDGRLNIARIFGERGPA
jgi:hypothetical protein